MKFNYLAVIVPRKWLPQNTEQTRKQAWAAVTQLLLPDLGKFYSRFYPASQPWGQDISAPYSVVLGREDPVTFLNVFHQAKKKQEEAISFHEIGMLSNINLEQTQKIGDTLICHVNAESNEAMQAHSLWHLAMAERGTPAGLRTLLPGAETGGPLSGTGEGRICLPWRLRPVRGHAGAGGG